MNLADAIRAHARERPTHPAVEHRGWVLSYAAFDRAVDAAASALRAKGIAPGEHVGIGLGDRPEHLAWLFGAARCGAVFVPIDCRWTAPEKARVCASFGVKLLVHDEGAGVPGLPALRVAADWAERCSADAAAPSAPGGEAPLAIYLSSGTTGQPKGPVLTHANMAARFDIYRRHLGLGAADRFACVTPLYFSASRGFAMCILHAGGTVVQLSLPMPAGELVGAIQAARCTSAALVPTLIRRLLDEPASAGHRLPGLRTLISTGAPLNPHERAEALARLSPHLHAFYGSSEGGGVSVLSPSDPPGRADSAGRILPGTAVRIVDQAGRELAPGATGRIAYRSAATAGAFHGDAAAGAQALQDGWFYPGDLGRIEDGFVYITGREKDMIIRGGVNVYPEEIERVLRAHPAVMDAAVVGAPSREFGEEIVAYLALRARADDRELAKWCRRELAPYKVPRHFFRVPELPKTPIGKPDKVALKARAAREAA